VAEVSPNSGENLQGGRPAIEYHLSIDMAKELAMVENSHRDASPVVEVHRRKGHKRALVFEIASRQSCLTAQQTVTSHPAATRRKARKFVPMGGFALTRIVTASEPLTLQNIYRPTQPFRIL